MKHLLPGLAVATLLASGVTACSNDDSNAPVPAGGINGPARVDPDSGGANSGTASTDGG